MAVKVLDSAQLNNKHPSVFVLSYELYGSGFRGYESATGQVYIMSDNPEGAIYRLEAPIKIAGKTVVSQGILKQILPLSEADKKKVYENNVCVPQFLEMRMKPFVRLFCIFMQAGRLNL